MRWCWLVLALVACGSDSDSGGGADGCGSCATGEICLVYFEDSGEREECAALPADCAGDETCECRGTMYDLCEDPFAGVGCSDSTAPTIISCNP